MTFKQLPNRLKFVKFWVTTKLAIIETWFFGYLTTFQAIRHRFTSNIGGKFNKNQVSETGFLSLGCFWQMKS
jgi:hypothetical protein